MEGKPEAQETFSQHVGGFPKVAGMSRSDLVYALDDVTRFLTAERGSLSGIRYSNKKIRKSLASKDKEIITKLEEQNSMTAYVRDLIKEDLQHVEKSERL